MTSVSIPTKIPASIKGIVQMSDPIYEEVGHSSKFTAISRQTLGAWQRGLYRNVKDGGH